MDPNLHIFILAGQSNMSGRGELFPVDEIPLPNILMLNDQDEFVPAKEPLHYYEPDRPGTGPGIPFAKYMAEQVLPGVRIGLVPCAVGGSAIQQWLADEHYRGVTLYSNLLYKTRVAQSKGSIKALLWHQGESNTYGGRYTGYRELLHQFFNKYRTDIQLPDLPVIAGHLGEFLDPAEYPMAAQVNQDMDELKNEMQAFYVVNANGLTAREDQLHFNRASMLELGERMAKKFLSVSQEV